MDVIIHDGGYVAKLDGETYFPPELLEECAHYIEEYFEIPMKLTQKEITYEWVDRTQTQDPYAIRKLEFEKRNFFVKDTIVHINEDNTIDYIPVATMNIQQKCNNHFVYNPQTEKKRKEVLFQGMVGRPRTCKV